MKKHASALRRLRVGLLTLLHASVASDEFGRRSVRTPTDPWEFQAPVRRPLEFDATRLTWRHNGFDRNRTDRHGLLIKEILA